MTLGQRLKDARQTRGWTQKRLAEIITRRRTRRIIGLESLANNISKWERGVSLPSLPGLVDIAGAFSLTPSELLKGVQV